MVKKGGLGRGLGDLLGLKDVDKIDVDRDAVEQLELCRIKPSEFQPRKVFQEKELEGLAQSIRELGVLQPIIVRKSIDGKYELIAGERRLRASKIAGADKIPAVIREYSNKEVMQIALVENLQRADLNAIEVARAYKNLIEECSLTQEKLAERLGKSRTSIANTMRLLNLAVGVQDALAAGLMSEGQARPLLAVTDDKVQLQLSERIIEEGLSARAVENMVRDLLTGGALEAVDAIEVIGPVDDEDDILVKKAENSRAVAELYISEAKERMQNFFGTKVFIKRGKSKGKIEIEFYSPEDLVRIVDNVLQGEDNAGVEIKADTVKKIVV